MFYRHPAWGVILQSRNATAAAGTIWDASTIGDLTATPTAGTLSGSNLIFTVVSPSGASVFTNAGYHTGKKYLECTWTGTGVRNTLNGNANFIAIFRRSSYVWNTVGCFQALGDSAWQVNAVAGSTPSTALNASPMVIGIAVDFGSSRAWAGSNAVGTFGWNESTLASQDPAAGLGGFDFSAANNATDYRFGVMDFGGAAGDTIALNVGGSTFFYGLPTGYSAWG